MERYIKFLPLIVEEKVYSDSPFFSRGTFYTESSTLSHQSIAFSCKMYGEWQIQSEHAEKVNVSTTAYVLMLSST